MHNQLLEMFKQKCFCTSDYAERSYLNLKNKVKVILTEKELRDIETAREHIRMGEEHYELITIFKKIKERLKVSEDA